MPTCGTIYAYNEGCRCARCRFAVAEAKRRQRASSGDALVRLLFRDRPDWYDQAACKGNTKIMYDITDMDRALAICAGCEVRDPCRKQARADREQGVAKPKSTATVWAAVPASTSPRGTVQHARKQTDDRARVLLPRRPARPMPAAPPQSRFSLLVCL